MNTEVQRTTDLASWQISDGHISAMVIQSSTYLVIVGVLGVADRMTQHTTR